MNIYKSERYLAFHTPNINNQQLTITNQSYDCSPTILDHTNQPLPKSQQTKILNHLTKEINLPWIPNLYQLINHFPHNWIELLQNPPIIPNQPHQLYRYAQDIIKGRFPQAEPTILTDPWTTYYYARDILKGKWKEAEPIILKDPWTAHCYARHIIKGPWKKAEPTILTNPYIAYSYARDIIKGKWPQAEPLILTTSWSHHYTTFINNQP